jgi:hypothetical protein
MPTHTTTTDPRSIITPDAFEVSEDLLGMPLARPARRLGAMIVDLVVIGVITLLTDSFALVLGVLAAFFFIRVSFKRTQVRGSVFDRAMRLSLGCLGLFIGGVTLLIWAIVTFGPPDLGSLADVADVPGVEVRTGQGAGGRQTSLRELAGFLGGGMGLLSAEDADEARDAMEVLVRRGRNVGTSDAEIRRVILDLAPDDAPWAGEAEAILDDVLATAGEEAPADSEAVAEADSAVLEEDELPPVASLSVPRVLEEYAVLLRDDELTPAETSRRADLRAVLLQEIAGDTLTALENEVAQVERIAENRQEVIDELMQEVEQQSQDQGGGLFGWLRNLVDELGFGFGWATLYMTVILSWWNGQTVGKKLMGIRVLRLDGGPVTWWTAFERAGGYAAGFATGLLGFAQVFWDANRQAIHDRIVGTVVVVDGAERVGNWESAL